MVVVKLMKTMPLSPVAVPISGRRAPASSRVEGNRLVTGNRLPQMWPGLALVTTYAVILLIEALDPSVSLDKIFPLFVLIGLSGWLWWMSWVYRIHKVLAAATNSRYPVTPRKAVLYHFVPLYNMIWVLKWTRQLSKFVNSQRLGTMSSMWPGICLLVGEIMPGSAALVGRLLPNVAFLGNFRFALAAARLLVYVCVGLYLRRKLSQVLPQESAIRNHMEHIHISLSAGLGAGFGSLLGRGMWEISRGGEDELWHEAIAVIFVLVAVIGFLDPLFERMRIALNVAEDHPTIAAAKSRHYWSVAVFTVFLATLFHGVVHEMAEKHLGLACVTVAEMLLVSGGITYFWIAGAWNRPPRAARSGLLSGATIGLCTVLSFWAVKNPSLELPANFTFVPVIDATVNSALPWTTPRLISGLLVSQLSKEGKLDLLWIVLPWTILGLAGGIVVDRLRGKQVTLSLGVCIFGVALLLSAVGYWQSGRLSLEDKLGRYEQGLGGLGAVVGWGLGLLARPASERMLAGGRTSIHKAAA